MNSRTKSKSEYRVPDKYAKEYLANSEGITLTPGTAKSYDSNLTEYVSYLSGLDLTVLTAEFSDVLGFIEECVRIGNRQSTIESKISTVGELYRYIRLRTDAGEQLELDPLRFREIDFDRYNTPQKIEREALDRGEIRKLFDAFDSYRNRLMTIVGVETGLRNSDIRNLRVSDINNKVIHVADPKNSKSYDVPISSELDFELNYWLDHQRNAYPTATHSKYVFLSQDGGRLEQNGTFNEIIKEAARQAEIQEPIGKTRLSEAEKDAMKTDKEYREWHRVTPHTLRHSFITLLKDAGVSLPYRMLVANHDDPETTLRYTSGDSAVFKSIRDKYDPPR